MRLHASIFTAAVLSLAPHLAGCEFGCLEIGCPPVAVSLSVQRPDGARIEADSVIIGVDGRDFECSIPDSPDDEYETFSCQGLIQVTRGRAERCVDDGNSTRCDGSGPPNVRIEMSESVGTVIVLSFQRGGETTAVQAFPPRYRELGSCSECELWEQDIEMSA
jgi:hypothetical protein